MKITSKPAEPEKPRAEILARACEKTNADVPDKKENQELSNVIQTLMEILTDEDLRSVAEVYRGALHANQRHWVDEGKDPKSGRARGHWEVIPDFKTRIAAANMIAAYKEGLPVQRQVVLTKAFESAEETIKRIRQCPELVEAIKGLTAAGVEVEAGGELIDIETVIQESGSETKALLSD